MTESLPTLLDRIDDILPQTQCRKCGYSGCRPYAEAIANREADINKCPPGGEEGIRELSNLLGVEFKPFGADVVLAPPSVAFIDENLCIGCTLCLQACPVDAISGASRQMHTIIAPLCTGCELCVAPCPVDCISMLPLPQEAPSRDKKHATAKAARERYQFRLERIERGKREKAEKLAQKERDAVKPAAAPTDAQALIHAALERARAQAAAVKPQNTERLTPAQQAQIAEIEARRAKIQEVAHPDTPIPKK
ncbi:MAG: electron transport complex subunit RsxB [Gallionellaceae bacterium]|jgi:electron transport complex protein RnfB|nr:electron transport complex subunit RsxB [Gallionellaceae bacterium]